MFPRTDDASVSAGFAVVSGEGGQGRREWLLAVAWRWRRLMGDTETTCSRRMVSGSLIAGWRAPRFSLRAHIGHFPSAPLQVRASRGPGRGRRIEGDPARFAAEAGSEWSAGNWVVGGGLIDR